MPAEYWGFIDPERKRIEKALLSAQLARLEEQPMGAGGGLAGALEDDSLEWEKLEFQRQQLKEQTELAKAQQLLLERKMTLEEEEAEAPFTIGESYITREGEPLYEPPMRAGLGETIVRPTTGEMLKEPFVKIGTATLIDTMGNVVYSEPEVNISGSEMIVTNRATGEVINRIDIERVPRGFKPQLDTKGNVYITNLDTGESELAFPSAYYEMEVELKGRELDVEEERTEALLYGYDVEKYGDDIAKYIADLGYVETIDKANIERDIWNSRNLTAIKKQELIYELGVLTNESEERRNTATIEAGDRKLVSERYKVGYVPQSAEEALAYEDAKAQIEASYAPYTSPNDMNIGDAEAWLAYEAGIELFVDKGKTDEKIRYENMKARAGRTPEDILKQRAISMMGIPEGAGLGRELLELPLEELGLEREKLEFKREEAELKRQGEAMGETREDTEYLMSLMLRATATHKATLGLYTEEDKVAAANTLLELIRTDTSIPPETKMRWLETAPSLMGVTLAEELKRDRPYFDWFRGMWNQALTEAAGEAMEMRREVERFEKAPTTLPTKTRRGLSFAEIQKEVNRIYRETGSRKDVTKYLKKYGMTIDDYREELQKVTPTE